MVRLGASWWIALCVMAGCSKTTDPLKAYQVAADQACACKWADDSCVKRAQSAWSDAEKHDADRAKIGESKRRLDECLDKADPTAGMERFADRMCACKDAQCADQVAKDMSEWSKHLSPDGNPTDAQIERARALTERLTSCGSKLTTATVSWRSDRAQAIADAKAQHRPAVLLFAAEWSSQSKEYEIDVLGGGPVQKEIADRFVAVRFDVTSGSDADAKDQEMWQAQAVPTVILLDSAGAEAKRFVSPPPSAADFLGALQAVK
jgi:hypothetical protein